MSNYCRGDCCAIGAIFRIPVNPGVVFLSAHSRDAETEDEMKRVILIDKCQDCNATDCKLRTMCGLIPDECPLLIALSLPVHETSFERDAEGYLLAKGAMHSTNSQAKEHQLRSYRRKK